LERYCIENYLIDEEAVAIAIQGRLKCEMDTVKQKLKFEKWYKIMTAQFLQLTILQALIIKHDLRLKFGHPSQHIKPKHWKIEKKGIAKLEREINTRLKAKGISITSEKNLIKTAISKVYCKNVAYCISGKYLLASLQRYICGITSRHCFEDDLKPILLHNFDISELNYMKPKVEPLLAK